ncbi:glyoxylate reductase [Malassezia cuniculi]|uniref:Glyoxylate reductase n=1 Tax=Malassezia cuniculi TaxID=948313 RepID=A0AAF0EQ45_9BASI|nr:glyoxylate reductase [Malassezia cuniculi]
MFPRTICSRALRASNVLQRAYSTARPQVLLMDDILLAHEDLKRLESRADIIRNETKDRAELIRAFESGGPYANIKGLYRHFGGARSIRVSGRFDPELVSKLPSSLRFIVHNGAGYDQLNVATADTALFLLIGAMRNFALAMGQLDAGVFNSQFPFREATDPAGTVLGIVGAGGIGQEFARKAAHALGVRVVYHNRNRLDAAKEAEGMPEGRPMEYVSSFEELLKISDAVSLNCPLTPATRHLMSTEQFKLMKPTAVLINTARGPVVDEQALVTALENGEIAGAGLDVYENEVRIYLHKPSVHPGLMALRGTKALLLPHVGTLSLQTQTSMEAACLRNLEHGLETGKLSYTVREQEGLDLRA